MSKSAKTTGKKNKQAPPRKVSTMFLLLALLAATAIAAFLILKNRQASQNPPAAHHAGNPDARNSKSAMMVNRAPAPSAAPENMVWIPGGTFQMGCADCDMPDALPLHPVTVDGFWMDATPMTNAEFEKFVKATGYLTIAERPLNPRDFPAADPKNLIPGSAVFTPPTEDVPLDDITRWWRYVPDACWKRPEGANSTIKGREDHPVVHIAWDDAVAYTTWAGKRLPTEAEFEFAARGGLANNHYAWGNDLKPQGKWATNIWQGRFPSKNTTDDGYIGTSPVKAFPPNLFGLYDVGGNVWQWCADWYRPDYYAQLAAQGVAVNPQGPAESYDPHEPGAKKRVQKSGSFLCSDEYCSRYLVGSRGRGATDSGSSNVSFRCVKSP